MCTILQSSHECASFAANAAEYYFGCLHDFATPAHVSLFFSNLCQHNVVGNVDECNRGCKFGHYKRLSDCVRCKAQTERIIVSACVCVSPSTIAIGSFV